MKSSDLVHRLALVALSLCFVAGCSQKAVLDRQVKADTTEEFAAFQASLIAEFTPRQVQDFDTAIQELKLAEMNKGVASAALREKGMRAAANGQPVHDVLVLGWKARHSRLNGELKDMMERHTHDAKLLSRPGSEDSTRFLSNVTRNETDMIARLKNSLEETDQRLAEWDAHPPQIVRAN